MQKILFSIILFLLPEFAFANIKVIRDSETEDFLTKISKPIFMQAGLSANAVNIHIVNDDSLNAFVAGGRNMFLNTGLIIAADTLESLVGVIAHESGHIAGGHLIKMSSDMDTMTTSLAVGYILGIATALSGSPDVGQALLLGSSHVAERSILKYSRNHEEAADEAALKYLYNLNIDPNGMLDFFEQIKTNENISSGSGDVYTRSHPLTTERMLRIKARIASYGDKKYANYPKSDYDEFTFVKIKLKCFITDNPEQMLLAYQGNSQYDIYARAILSHRIGDLDAAVTNVNLLLANDPKNPYLIELKAQFYYESGKAKEALENYKRASAINTKDPLLKIQIAESIISLNDPSLYPTAVDALDEALLIEHSNSVAWRRLSLIYERQGKSSLSNLALAEAKYYSGDYSEAVILARSALEVFKKNPDKYTKQNVFRAEELLDFSKRKLKEEQ